MYAEGRLEIEVKGGGRGWLTFGRQEIRCRRGWEETRGGEKTDLRGYLQGHYRFCLATVSDNEIMGIDYVGCLRHGFC